MLIKAFLLLGGILTLFFLHSNKFFFLRLPYTEVKFGKQTRRHDKRQKQKKFLSFNLNFFSLYFQCCFLSGGRIVKYVYGYTTCTKNMENKQGALKEKDVAFI